MGETRRVTASTDGAVATIAPIDKGVWWERWADASTWRKETEALKGDSAPPEELVAASRKDWVEKRKKITDDNAARHDRNLKLLDDPSAPKKGKNALKAPTPPNPRSSDADYTKSVQSYNAWAAMAARVRKGSKFEALDDLGVARSPVEQGWLDRGLTVDFWMRRIDDKCAEEIQKFRKQLPEKGTQLSPIMEAEPKKDYQKLGQELKLLNEKLKEHGALKQKLRELQLQLKVAQSKKKRDPDAVSNLETKVRQTQAEVDEAEADRQAALAKRQALENRGLLSSFNGASKGSSAGKPIGYWENLAVTQFGVADGGVGAAYYAFCAGPDPREGTPATVVTYDATFTWGAGFNVTTAEGWQLLRDIADAAGYDAPMRASLAEIWTFFKKCGIYIHASGTQSDASAYPIDVVHIEEGSDGKPHGYVITNKTQVKTGVYFVAKQSHHSKHGAAYEYIRHTPVLLRAFIAAAIADKVPGQQNDDAAPAKETIARLNFRVFCNLHKDTLRLPQFMKGRALRILLIHYMHWGPIFRVNTMMLWAMSRQLVRAKVTLKDGATAKAAVGAMSDVADIELTPSFDTDVQFARLIGPYAMAVSKSSRVQMNHLWTAFCDDLREHDGQAALVAKLPKYFLQTVDALKASDSSITDAIIDSDYRTETLDKKVYVLGKKRDMDAIGAYRSKPGEPITKALISVLEAHKNSKD